MTDTETKLVELTTERIEKQGPILKLKGKDKADFENEFNRFKQIAGLINWPAMEEIYKNIILWFMNWGVERYFMEKATEWLGNNAMNYMYIENHENSRDLGYDVDKMVEDFKKEINKTLKQ